MGHLGRKAAGGLNLFLENENFIISFYTMERYRICKR